VFHRTNRSKKYSCQPTDKCGTTSCVRNACINAQRLCYSHKWI